MKLQGLDRLRGRGEQPTEPIVAIEPATQEFVAYGVDCVIRGTIALGATRLTDLLNDHDELILGDVRVAAFGSPEEAPVASVVVPRDEVLLIHASGSRGDAQRRRRTMQHPVAMQVGPYHVRGYLHALPGTEPVSSFIHRQSMVPLTNAWIEFMDGKVQRRDRIDVLVVNRQQVDWVVRASGNEVEMPDLPLKAIIQQPLKPIGT